MESGWCHRTCASWPRFSPFECLLFGAAIPRKSAPFFFLSDKEGRKGRFFLSQICLFPLFLAGWDRDRERTPFSILSFRSFKQVFREINYFHRFFWILRWKFFPIPPSFLLLPSYLQSFSTTQRNPFSLPLIPSPSWRDSSLFLPLERLEVNHLPPWECRTPCSHPKLFLFSFFPLLFSLRRFFFPRR